MAVLAFINECRWDPHKKEVSSDLEFEVGRRMMTSPRNRVSPATTVTPDCIVQFQTNYGIVAEAKLGLPKNEASWDADIEQLEKYDDHLLGWWTDDETIARHDLLALVPLSRAVKFGDRVESGKREKKWRFRRKLAIVGFYKTSGLKEFLSLKRERGRLTLPSLDERLRESRQIPIALLVTNYRDRKFVDHEPPTPYILQIIWDHLFVRYAGDEQNREGGLVPLLKVSVGQVTRDLQEYFGFQSKGPRSPEIPRARWVRKSLDMLVKGQLAVRSGEDQYTIHFKRTKGDTLKKFGKLCFRLEQKSSPPPREQLDLIKISSPDEPDDERVGDQ